MSQSLVSPPPVTLYRPIRVTPEISVLSWCLPSGVGLTTAALPGCREVRMSNWSLMVMSLWVLRLSWGWCLRGAMIMLSRAMASDTEFLAYWSGAMLQYRVPCLQNKHYDLKS